MHTTSHDDTPAGSLLSRLWTAVGDELRERRRSRVAHRALMREVSSCSSLAEVDDLLGALRGQEGAEADEMRTILTRNLVRSQRASRLAG